VKKTYKYNSGYSNTLHIAFVIDINGTVVETVMPTVYHVRQYYIVLLSQSILFNFYFPLSVVSSAF